MYATLNVMRFWRHIAVAAFTILMPAIVTYARAHTFQMVHAILPAILRTAGLTAVTVLRVTMTAVIALLKAKLLFMF